MTPSAPSRPSGRAAACRWWWAGRTSTSAPCSTGSSRSRPRTRSCGGGSRPSGTPIRAAVRTRLAALDPESAARIPARDRQRTLRALEVGLVAGRPMSELWRDAAGPAPVFEYVMLGLVRRRAASSMLGLRRGFGAMLRGGIA